VTANARQYSTIARAPTTVPGKADVEPAMTRPSRLPVQMNVPAKVAAAVPSVIKIAPLTPLTRRESARFY
jgi:hypothetical protein